MKKLQTFDQLNESSKSIQDLIKRKLDGEKLSTEELLKLHNHLLKTDDDYCKAVDKLMSKDLKKCIKK